MRFLVERAVLGAITLILTGAVVSLPCFAETDLQKQLKQVQAAISLLQKENAELKEKIEELNRKVFFWQNDSKSWETIAEIRKSGEGGIGELNKELDLAHKFAEELKKEVKGKDFQLKRARTLNWILIVGAVIAVVTK